MSHISRVIAGLKPALMMVVVQVAYGGLCILYKMAANDGKSLSVITAYRSLVASACVLPLAYFFERKCKPKITAEVLFQAFLCGIFGASLQQNLFAEAVALANPTYAAAMYNIIPGVTLILATFFRLERWNIGTSAGKAKVLGILMGIGGAMILTFYKGTEIRIWSTHVNLTRHIEPHDTQVWGSALAFGYSLSYSIWLIIEARMSEKFPWHYTSAALMSVMGSIQSIVYALCVERDWSQWKLGWNITLLTTVYTGVVASGIAWVLITWCVRLKGPLFASIFNPLLLVLMAIAGSLLLDESLNLGSVIGSLFAVIGLYLVLWGKGKELKRAAELKLTKDSLQVEPLEIITTDQANAISVENDGSEMKSCITAQSSFLTENDHLSRKGTEEANEREEIPVTIKDSKPSA